MLVPEQSLIHMPSININAVEDATPRPPLTQKLGKLETSEM
jgi:hypothetical protein